MGAVVSVVHRLVGCEDDTELARFQKTALLFCNVWILCLAGLSLSHALTIQWEAGITVNCLCFSGFMLHSAMLICTKRLSKWLVNTWTLAAVLYFAFSDVSTAPARWQRWWPCFVIVVDLLLVFRAPEWMSMSVVTCGVALLIIIQVEWSGRLGLFDLPFCIPDSERWVTQVCEERLPCAIDTFKGSNPQLVIFALDYYFTRGFAKAVELEQSRIKASIDATAHVASCLATFDLESAAAVLRVSDGEGEKIPVELAASLESILEHLRLYKPHLPQALLTETFDATKDARSEQSEDDSPLGASWRSERSNGSLELVPSPPTVLALRRTRLSLLTLSFTTREEVSDGKEALATFVEMHSMLLSSFLHVLHKSKGIVDFYSGSLACVSFNASRACAQHGLSSVRAAKMLLFPRDDDAALTDHDFVLRGGVATGVGKVGFLGATDMLRHCTVGVLPAKVASIERAARHLRHPLLCSANTAGDCVTEHVRVLLHDFFLDEENPERTAVLYEVLPEDCLLASDSKEWMYALEDSGAQEWELYNRAGLAYHESGTEQAVEILERGGAPVAKSHAFQRALREARVVSFLPSTRLKAA
eukprot:Rhum_TRINITY_DN11410_c0_g1::Rhum_TRINITY_DN11410_c0_g1_i1::g.44513::m.44513